ncbi:unnamed protein product [Vicia faba]|uniref:Uncharacterized protein n=1 Tax=Vicia faba TaxID=3906 RepID=A0AAV0YM14_VICFA|nr:unnamed protein product [Vicia faba]
MQEDTVKMTNTIPRLKYLGMAVEDSFMVQFIVNSLPFEYGAFQINYNTMKDKWGVNELIRKLIQEENRIKNFKIHYVNLVHGAGKTLKPKAKNFKKKGTY